MLTNYMKPGLPLASSMQCNRTFLLNFDQSLGFSDSTTAIPTNLFFPSKNPSLSAGASVSVAQFGLVFVIVLPLAVIATIFCPSDDDDE